MKKLLFISFSIFISTELFAAGSEIKESVLSKLIFVIIPIIITGIVTYFTIRIQTQKDQLKAAQNALNEKKLSVYTEVMTLLFDQLLNSRVNKSLTDQQLVKKIFGIKKDIFVYAPDEIFIQFSNFMSSTSENPSVKEVFYQYFKLVKLMRKDLGHINSKLTENDFLLFFMQNKEEYEKFKKEHGI